MPQIQLHLKRAFQKRTQIIKEDLLISKGTQIPEKARL